jgi:hypothetical protein
MDWWVWFAGLLLGAAWLCLSTTFVAKCRTGYRISCFMWRSRHQLYQTAYVLSTSLMQSGVIDAPPATEGLPPPVAPPRRHHRTKKAGLRRMKAPSSLL